MEHSTVLSSVNEHDVRVWCGGPCSGNLQLIQEATASKVLLEGSTALGVEYTVGNDSSPQVVMATEEVILSAGAYASPKLLMVRFFRVSLPEAPLKVQRLVHTLRRHHKHPMF